VVEHQLSGPVRERQGELGSNPETDGRMKYFKDGRVIEFEGAGHWVHHDRLDGFLTEVRAFLA